MKRVCYFLLTAMLLFALCVTAAAQTLPFVIDNAELLTESEQTALSQELERIRQECGVDVVVLTEYEIYAESPSTYADDYYDRNGYGDDGVLLLINMEERQWYISTAGRCIDQVDIDRLAEDFLTPLSDGQYYKAFSAFAAGCEKAMYVQQDGEFVLTDSGGTKQNAGGKTLLICLGIGLVVGLITVLVMKAQLKTVRSQNAAGNYVAQGLQLTKSTDMFLYHTTTRREKPQNNTTHRSSSGRSHGGGGGHF